PPHDNDCNTNGTPDSTEGLIDWAGGQMDCNTDRTPDICQGQQVNCEVGLAYNIMTGPLNCDVAWQSGNVYVVGTLTLTGNRTIRVPNGRFVLEPGAQIVSGHSLTGGTAACASHTCPNNLARSDDGSSGFNLTICAESGIELYGTVDLSGQAGRAGFGD